MLWTRRAHLNEIFRLLSGRVKFHQVSHVVFESTSQFFFKLWNTKFERKKLTCVLENDMRNLANFHQNTWKHQIWDFDEILLSKIENAWLKNYRGVMCNDTEEWWKIWRGIDLSFQNWHQEFDEFWLEHSKVSKTCTLMGWFWQKFIMFELNK